MNPVQISEPTPRERILAAAAEVFAQNGYRAGSLNDIAKLSGYTRAGLLHYYPNKPAILLALLESRDAELGLDQDTTGYEFSFTEMVQRMSEVEGHIARDRQMMQLWHALLAETSNPDHPAREWVQQRQARLRSFMARAIESAVQTGDLPATTDVEGLAAALQGVVEGLEGQWLVDDQVSIERGLTALLSLVKTLR